MGQSCTALSGRRGTWLSLAFGNGVRQDATPTAVDGTNRRRTVPCQSRVPLVLAIEARRGEHDLLGSETARVRMVFMGDVGAEWDMSLD